MAKTKTKEEKETTKSMTMRVPIELAEKVAHMISQYKLNVKIDKIKNA